MLSSVLRVPSSLVQLKASSEVTLCGEHCWAPGKADSHEHSVGPAGGSKTQQTDDWTSEQVWGSGLTQNWCRPLTLALLTV